ncbi:hypothetical protein KAR91_54800 [Candidatus Pacearchaeota archaeon]|nr:hypothetical protein [Candidatus Pacearchaeota archaeon]
MNPLWVVMGAIQESCEDIYEEINMTEKEFHSDYRFAKTTDERMKDLFTFPQAMDLMKAGTVSLFVIVDWERLIGPIGFFRKIIT